MPILYDILSKTPRLSNVGDAIDSMVPPNKFQNPKQLQSLNKFFESNHAAFQFEPLQRISEVQPLPGPLFTLSFSFGGPNALNAIALSGAVKRAVMLAPFFPPDSNDPLTFQWVAGALGLFKRFQLGPIKVPLAAITNAYIASAVAIRDWHTLRARESTQVFCVFAEDDTVVDVPKSKEVCQGKLGGSFYTYPKLGLGHLVTPETGNPYSDALMEQIVKFFENGQVDDSRFLVANDE